MSISMPVHRESFYMQSLESPTKGLPTISIKRKDITEEDSGEANTRLNHGLLCYVVRKQSTRSVERCLLLRRLRSYRQSCGEIKMRAQMPGLWPSHSGIYHIQIK